jgi:hypothetical protein
MNTAYIFGFMLDKPNDFLIDNIINLHYFYIKYVNTDIQNININLLNSSPEITTLLQGNLNETKTLLIHNFILNDFMPKYNFNKIIFLYKSIFCLFNSLNKLSKIPPAINIDRSAYSFSIENIDLKNKLLLRTGVIELQAVNAFLYGDKVLIKEALNNIIKNYKNEDYIYSQRKECWITTIHSLNHYEIYLKLLMTNAGFYIDDNLENAYNNLEFFVNNYKKSIIDSDYLMNWDFFKFILFRYFK